MGQGRLADAFVLVDDVDQAAIPEEWHRETRHALERRCIVQQSGQDVARFGEEALYDFVLLALEG
jgi:hypothetical protein